MKKVQSLPALIIAIFFLLIFSLPVHAENKTLQVLNETAVELYEQGNYSDAEELAERTLTIAEETFGSDDPRIVPFLNNLAVIHYARGKYADAEARYERAVALTERAFGAEHPRLYSLREGLERCRQKRIETKLPEEDVSTNQIVDAAGMPSARKTEQVSAKSDIGNASQETASAVTPTVEKMYTVQVGAFRNLPNAKRLQDRLSKNGYDVSISDMTTANNEILYKVQAGEFSKRKKARLLAREIRTLMGLETYITTK